ncbi:hypothetical protein C900_04400 [Fulvivirga imtechensis AK7]|uniref:Uncharacterized protein n=1 Tax=Fulvivirga imtechensis AK7 TaxID=1237149 RepID=L8JMI6_9BACT|nr:hypothetical protein C900_04400 [Fulvivirga imtechensis AK7]
MKWVRILSIKIQRLLKKDLLLVTLLFLLGLMVLFFEIYSQC